ncbi:MAG: MIP/aquaporin family protein [Paracoccaceae bacterium]
MRKLIAEAFGTYALIFMGASSVVFMSAASPFDVAPGLAIGFLGIGFAFSFTVVAMVYTVGPISGAHLNPAVTLAMCLAGRMPWAEFPGYAAAQIVGGFAASLTILAMSGDPGVAANTIGEPGLLPALIFEVVATFLFVSVILGVTDDRYITDVAGIVIGLMLVSVHLAGITVSGSSINPTRSLVTGAFDATALSQLWVYVVAPLAGAGLAGVAHATGVLHGRAPR